MLKSSFVLSILGVIFCGLLAWQVYGTYKLAKQGFEAASAIISSVNSGELLQVLDAQVRQIQQSTSTNQ